MVENIQNFLDSRNTQSMDTTPWYRDVRPKIVITTTLFLFFLRACNQDVEDRIPRHVRIRKNAIYAPVRLVVYLQNWFLFTHKTKACPWRRSVHATVGNPPRYSLDMQPRRELLRIVSDAVHGDEACT